MTQTEQQQTEKIEAGLAAAKRGEFVTDAEMEQIFNRYQPEARRRLDTRKGKPE